MTEKRKKLKKWHSLIKKIKKSFRYEIPDKVAAWISLLFVEVYKGN